ASNADGIVLVKDLTSLPIDDYLVVHVDMKVVNNTLYFKVINGSHDELWKSDGSAANTQLIKSFLPDEAIYNLFDGNGTLYFGEFDDVYGVELWKSDGTDAGTLLVKDISPGTSSSYPENLTFCNGKLLFRATDKNTGDELWVSNGTGAGTSLVKDINSTSTLGSDAGFIYKGIASNGNAVVFGATTPELGVELYRSDGTSTGTRLLNDIAAGEQSSYPNSFIYKNGVNYFIVDNLIGTTIYKTDGTTGGLKKIVYDIDRVVYYVTNFNVTDNGLPFYILANRNTGAYELWRSDGTAAGTYMLTSNLYYNSYIVTAGNTVYFVAGDNEHGFELWKSNGTVAGTKMVKDIRPGINGSYPYSLFVYKNNVYFGAHDGLGLNYQTWKSDGTEKGTIKLKNITPAFYDYNYTPDVPIFCVSNNKLFFTAYDYQTYGAELWETNGTAGGTKLIKDINPFGHSFPNYLTDVNGELYFSADDGVHGNELWTSKGTASSTKLVKDITSPYNYGYLYNFCNAGGKLYFLNGATYPNTLWSSDGTASNTNQITDPGLNGLSEITRLTAVGNKLFFGAYSQKYGKELYVGEACASNFTAGKAGNPEMLTSKITTKFDVLLYPNPAKGYASVQINGDAKDIEVTMADISGKVIWQKTFANSIQVSLPVEKIAAGIYIVTVKSGLDNKTLKLVKQ
ncbi:MAG: ELWxxDGT repeat protein, partial [Chitinophagaceae bacterium]